MDKFKIIKKILKFFDGFFEMYIKYIIFYLAFLGFFLSGWIRIENTHITDITKGDSLYIGIITTLSFFYIVISIATFWNQIILDADILFQVLNNTFYIAIIYTYVTILKGNIFKYFLNYKIFLFAVLFHFFYKVFSEISESLMECYKKKKEEKNDSI